jgi:GNAT superfamily N-acetyltransferase
MEFKTELLSPTQVVEGFDCGEAPLNDYLKRHALQSQAAGAARVYTVVLNGAVIGYHTLSAGSIEANVASLRLLKGLAHHAIPIVLLGRLAVTGPHQGRGLGRLLLRDAILRFLQAADIIGVRALLVHAKNARVAGFYAGFGFEPLSLNPLHMALLQKDARLTARGRAEIRESGEGGAAGDR